MGLSQSKLIIKTLEIACKKAENDGEDNIASVLSEQEFINSIRQLWARIPLKTRRSIGHHPDKGSGSSKKMRKAPNKSTITIPQAFTANLHLWENNPSLFFIEDSGISLELGRDPLAGSYKYISGLKRRTEIDTIRLRFWKVVFYRLKERLCLNHLRVGNVEIVARIISQSSKAGDELGLIRQRVSRWTDEGRRIDTLCRDTSGAKSLDNAHLGILFCLPDDIPDEVIRALPLAGPTREEEIRLLRHRGILKVDGWERLQNLGKTIFNYLWEKMESSISHFHLSELGSDWELQHTQSFRIQNPKFSYPGCDQGTNAPTIPLRKHRAATGTARAGGARSLRSTCLKTSSRYRHRTGWGGSQPAFHLFENIEPLQVPHGLGGSQPAFHLFENIEPLQVPHGLGGSQPTFHLFENIEPLQVPDGLGGSQPMTGTQSMFNQYEDSQALRQPFSGTFDDSLVAGRDSSNMYTQMPDDLPSNQPQNPSYQQFTVPVSVN
ncbi:hypothetical protein N7516_008933 [Penicillium verrucosum]|uniref:uncharacterized protein n=1 Tax=Penicillium verrucosum TaxID=60171 RepID=UPI002545A6A5|nr:uncharacterized protein N7516_008933 [Penicillium verrucosum]KAJ5927160.1 hypothetical protein N7516_008933 [Penicillium verrucosum]